MKKLCVVFNTLESNVLCFVLFMSVCMMGFTACSEEEDDDEPQGGTIEIGVPPSVVDGVRASQMGGIEIAYNEDGTINHAIGEDGTEYLFNYVSTRAATRSLESITATQKSGNESKVIKASNFTISQDGFITGYECESNYEDYGSDWWEKTSLQYVITYDHSNRISKIDMSGYSSDPEDSGSNSGTYSYGYGQNGELVNIKLMSGSTLYFEQVFQYGEQLNNKFNIMLSLLMPEELISDDNVFAVLGVTGYLGNTSAKLPTSARLSTYDPEFPEDNETYQWTIDYSLGANEVIYSYSIDGTSYPCKFVGVNVDVDIH